MTGQRKTARVIQSLILITLYLFFTIYLVFTGWQSSRKLLHAIKIFDVVNMSQNKIYLLCVLSCKLFYLPAHSHTFTQPPAVVIKGVLDSEMDWFSHPWTHGLFFLALHPSTSMAQLVDHAHTHTHKYTLRFLYVMKSRWDCMFRKGAKVLMRLLGLHTDRENQISLHAVHLALICVLCVAVHEIQVSICFGY